MPPPATIRPRARALAMRYRQQLRFAVVGAVNTSVHVAVFSALYYGLGAAALAANTAGFGTALMHSFVLNKYWTFAESRTNGRISRQLPVFAACTLIGLGLSNLTIWLLQPVLPVEAGLAAAIVVTFAWNFWSTRRFVYNTPAGA